MEITYSLSDLDNVAARVISESKSSILLFEGEIGAGKTTLIKSMCKALGVNSRVSSPTFSLVNEYIAANQGLIYHFDFYRIVHQEEVLDIGFEQYLERASWVFIEWPEKIGNLIPENSQKATIYRLNENDRKLVFF